MRCEPFWQIDVSIGDPFDDADVNAGIQPSRHELLGFHRLAGCHGAALKFAHLIEDMLKLLSVIFQSAFGLLHGNVSAPNKSRRVTFANRSLAVDDVIHFWLRHRWVVAFVVATAAVTDHVDDDIFAEGLPVVHGELGHPDTGFRIVAIDVEYRCANRFRHISGIFTGPRVLRRRGEPDLVVHDNVHGAAGTVPTQKRQVERLGHHALPGEGGIAVEGDRQHSEALGSLIEEVLLGSGDAFQYRVHCLQV